jgi:hypothetical protein
VALLLVLLGISGILALIFGITGVRTRRPRIPIGRRWLVLTCLALLLLNWAYLLILYAD